MTKLIVLSSFDWSAPGTPEMITETASIAGIETIHFSKPKSLVSIKTRTHRELPHVKCKTLNFISSRFSKLKLFEKLQCKFVTGQIIRSINKTNTHDNQVSLIYTNLGPIVGILSELKPYLKNFFYICADYSNLDSDFQSNALAANKILTIPDSMISKINCLYPEKALHWPQMTSYFEEKNKISQKTKVILNGIPKPRAVYSGLIKPRITSSFYEEISGNLPDISFISFTEKREVQINKNRYEIPWLEKKEMLAFLSECDAGIMPYNIDDPHNLHCVPLKLFEYFQAGIPVVSTKLINLEKYSRNIYLAENAKDFIYKLNLCLKKIPKMQNISSCKKISNDHLTVNRTESLIRLLNSNNY